jgi:tetratricopeptide (TPR) repeat protein
VIDYSNGLTYDPSLGKPEVQSPGPIRPRHPSGLHSDSTVILAGQYGPAGNYDDSIALYLKVYDTSPKTSFLAKKSLQRLSETYERSGKAAFIDLLHSLIAPTIPLKSELSVIARELEAHWLTRAGRFEDAIAMFQALHADYPANPEVDKVALFNIGEIYQACLNNHLKAVESLTHFRSKYPYDPLTPVAGLLMSSTAGPLASSPQVGGGTAPSGGPGPAAFELEPNYPNPCNPTTNIRYGLPHNAFVSLVVFNTLGQQVSTLVNDTQDAGYHEVRFDGSNLSSGVYFYRLHAGAFVEAKKLVLVR